MNENQELIDIITILDDYDFIINYFDMAKGLIRFANKDKDMIFTSTFEDAKRKQFIEWIKK